MSIYKALTPNVSPKRRTKAGPPCHECNDRMIPSKLQAPVYHILPPTTAIVDYVIGLEKLSASEQFFDDAQMAVSL